MRGAQRLASAREVVEQRVGVRAQGAEPVASAQLRGATLLGGERVEVGDVLDGAALVRSCARAR